MQLIGKEGKPNASHLSNEQHKNKTGDSLILILFHLFYFDLITMPPSPLLPISVRGYNLLHINTSEVDETIHQEGKISRSMREKVIKEGWMDG